MKNYKPLIIWEKWVDPYGQNLDSVEWPGYDKEHIVPEQSDTPFDQITDQKITKINAIATSMGIIPFNEHTDCTKIFNFWVGHTNFNITKKIATVLEQINGVETLDIFTRYRFRISFGKAFNDREIIDDINTLITEFTI